MIISFLKNICLYLNCFFIFYKTIQRNKPFIFHKFIYVLSSVLLSLTTIICKTYFQLGSYIIPFVLYYFFLILHSSVSPLKLLSSSLFSFSLTQMFYCISTMIIGLFSYPLRHYESNTFVDIVIILSCFLTTILTYVLFRKPKSKNITNAFNSYPTACVGALISILFFAAYTTEQFNNSKISSKQVALMISSIALAFMYNIFIRSQITKSYREKLRLLEVESLRTSQQEQANYISQLEKENERMGRIIHKDNRIVNAMADSVTEYLTDTTLSDTERYSKGVALAEHIESIRTDRQNILLSEEHIHPNPISQTGYVGVDALIAYMAKEAAQHHITLHFDFHTEFFENSSLCMLEEDLVHLLSDALKNAVIATSHNNGKAIKLSMLKLKGIPTIAISDSGIPFTIDTYMNFGLEKSSTHTDEGGSGIGLLDIWSLKEKYKATLYIDEHPTTDTFTKQLVFIFDKKNRYMISTNRYKEIQHQQSRADLYVVNPAVERSL